MIPYVVFYNKRGNKKLAIECSGVSNLARLEHKVYNVLNTICSRNSYTFMYKSINPKDDKEGILNNIPIISLSSLSGC